MHVLKVFHFSYPNLPGFVSYERQIYQLHHATKKIKLKKKSFLLCLNNHFHRSFSVLHRLFPTYCSAGIFAYFFLYLSVLHLCFVVKFEHHMRFTKQCNK